MDLRVSVLDLLLGIIVTISYLPRDSRATGCVQNSTRLVVGQNKFEGRVEVCEGGQWKTVCNRRWGDEEAQVVCRQLGFLEDTRTVPVTSANNVFGNAAPNSQGIIKKRWWCSGNEQELLSCPQESRSNCGHNRDAGVFCYGRTYDECQKGELRLANGTSNHSGRVEVCLDNFWGTVCDDGWDMRDATTVCKQLGLSDRGIPTRRAFFGEGIGPVHLSRAGCTSQDMNLLNCAIDKSAVNGCDHSEDAGVICSGPSNCSDGDVRLMGGENELEGRLEICYNGVWGTICDNGWDERDAAVVCNQLGFGQPGMLPVNQSFGAGMGPILLDNVACDQSHSGLLQCVHPQDIGIHDCDRENVAGVICSNASTTTITSTDAVTTFKHLNIPPNITNAEESDSMTGQSSAAVFGAVGGALAVVVVAIVLIVVVTVVMIATKRRKPNHQGVTGNGALDNPIYDGGSSVGAANLNASSSQKMNGHASDERDFQNPLYSETGPSCNQNTASKLPEAEGEYEGLYSDCTMNGEALYENTQNRVVRGALTSANGNTVHITASGACMYGNNNMQPTLDSIDEDTCTYSTLGPTELNLRQLTLLNQRQSVVEDEYSCLQHR